MITKILPLTFVAIGIFCLTVSLLPTKKICHFKHEQTLGWKILGALMLFFIFGYIFFAVLIIEHEISIVEQVVSIILCGGGIFVAMVTRMTMLTIQNINRIAALERHRALHDELTDLPNRTFLYERIHYGIIAAERQKHSFAILMMDLDRFKEINDALGHHYGDYLLQLIAPRLQKAVRETDTVSRLGGDEFAVVLPGDDVDAAIVVAQKIAKAMKKPFMIEGRNINVDISIGIAVFPQHGADAETLLSRADVAMYASKRGTANYAIYTEEYDEYTINRLMLTEELRTAIHSNQLYLLFQPIVDLTGENLYSAETLVRWRHPDQGKTVFPDDFISLAEQTGLIEQLTAWVLDNTLKQMAQWGEQGVEIRISVNLSAKNLYNINFPYELKKLLEKWQIDPGLLTLEITESSMMTDPDRAFQVIAELDALGVHFSIDDFGTGYFPFASLKQLPVKEIKIDKSFVQGMLQDETDMAIVRTTIDLANSMGLRSIAEGIEDARTLKTVKLLGCFTGQGFYLCPPIPADRLLVLALEKNLSIKSLQRVGKSLPFRNLSKENSSTAAEVSDAGN